MKNGLILLTALGVGLSLLLTGCVRYRKTIADQKEVIGELQTERLELEIRLADIKGDRVLLHDKVGQLEARISGQVAYQHALEQEVEELGGDKQALVNDHRLSADDQAQLFEEAKREQAYAQVRLEILRSMLARFKDRILEGALEVRVLHGMLTLVLPNERLFQPGGATLSEDGKRSLKVVAAAMTEIEGREFQVAGYTDELPVEKGMIADNWELSAAQSMAVVRALVELGVSPQRLSGSGYSKYRPFKPEEGRESSIRNWRIEIMLQPSLDELPDTRELELELR